MKLFNRALGISNRSSDERRNFAVPTTLASRPTMIKLLFSILGSGVLVVAGPMISCTVTHVSLVSIQILLELGRLCLATFQTFGN
jgi:hypothetical protein